jgi:hypothetical protein
LNIRSSSVNDAVVIARDPQPGDALMALPAICALAQRYDRLFLAMAHDQVRRLAAFPRNVSDMFFDEPSFRIATLPVYALGVAAAIPNGLPGCTTLHPTQYLFARAGLPTPTTVPQPQLAVSSGAAPTYDVLLAPWTTAPERTLTFVQAQALVHALRPLRVGVIGGASDPPLGDCYHEYGRPYADVVRMMRAAGAVVTVDAFPNRLAHAAGIAKHVLLATPATPPHWQGHPGAMIVRVNQPHFVQDTVRAVA